VEDQQQVTERDFNAVAAATAQKEAEAYELFSQRFDREFPKPPAPTVTMMQTIGWQFISIIIQSVFAIVLAALRTGSMFFEAAAGTNWGVQIAEAITAVGAIELGIVIFATIKSEIENSKTELTDLKSALKIDLRLLWTGIIACVGISVAAGLGVSFKGFGLELWWMKWIVAIAMGVGASLVAWVSGDILGAMLARWGNASALANLQYRHDLEEREDKKRQMWEAAPERQIARSELVELKEYIQANRYKAPKQARVTAVPQPIPQPAPRPRTSTRNNEVRIKVYDYLDRTWAMEQRIAGPTELVEQLGVSKGYVGGKDGVIQAWKTERNIPMPETTEELDAAQ
jgi:hypothetical protein